MCCRFHPSFRVPEFRFEFWCWCWCWWGLRPDARRPPPRRRPLVALRDGDPRLEAPRLEFAWRRASVSPFTMPFVNCFLNFVKAHTHTVEKSIKTDGGDWCGGRGPHKKRKIFLWFLVAGLVFIVGPFCCHQLFGISCLQILWHLNSSLISQKKEKCVYKTHSPCRVGNFESRFSMLGFLLSPSGLCCCSSIWKVSRQPCSSSLGKPKLKPSSNPNPQKQLQLNCASRHRLEYSFSHSVGHSDGGTFCLLHRKKNIFGMGNRLWRAPALVKQ